MLQKWLSYVTIPTYITLTRIALVPFMVHQIYNHNLMAAFALFALAAVTDVIDGAIARGWGMESALGGILDPIADKILFIGTYAGLALSKISPFILIPSWFLSMVIVHEMILIAGALYLQTQTTNGMLKPTLLGKRASFVQVLFIGWLFLCSLLSLVPLALFYSILFLIVCARLCTLMHYASLLYYRKS